MTASSSTQIFCTTTAHAAGVVDVTVTNTDTQSVTSTGAYTYQAAPTVTSVTPNGGPIGGGTTVSIAGTGFLAGATVAIGASNCGSLTVNSATQITCTTIAHAASAANVIVTNPDLQTGTLLGGFTYEVAPIVSSVSPLGGALGGGTLVTITGSGFLTGAAVVLGGNPCSSVTVVSSTSITCTTAAHAAGAVSVTVTNLDAQTNTLASAYTYQSAPVLTGVSPSAGALAGGTALSLTGTGFLTGATISVGGSICNSVTVSSATAATCVTTSNSAGTVDVVLTNSDNQASTLSASYTYEAAPTITSVAPIGGALGGNTLITLTGTGYVTGATITVASLACGSPLVLSSTSMTCLTPAHAAGPADIVVTNPDSQQGILSGGYSYENAPTISSVSPVFGSIAGGTSVTITGTGFVSGSLASVGGATCTVSLVTPTQVFCTTTAHAAGTVDVTVVNPDTQSATDPASYSYHVNPTVTSVTPVAGPLAGTNTLTIIGTGFLAGIGVRIGALTCTSVTLITATQLTCAAPAQVAGTYGITVTNTDGLTGSLAAAYTYEAAPTLSTVSPVVGPLAGGTGITLTGTGFLSGATVTLGGTACSSVVVVSGTSITCTTPAHVAGAVDIVVTNTDTQTATLSSSFTYQPAPVISTVSPIAGALAGNTTVNLVGSGFVAGATVTFGGTACTSLNVVNATHANCVTPAHAAGAVDVVWTNLDSQTFTLPSGYAYEAAPTLTSVSPVAGALGGATNITLTGTGFLAGASVTVGGAACTSVVVGSATTINCVTPAGSGTVDVVATNSDNQFATLTNGYTYEAAPTVTSVSPSAGPVAGNTAITVTGTGFLAGALVTMGGGSCTVTSITGTQIFCTTPAHAAGAVSVTVTNTDTQLASLGSAFTYNAAPNLTTVTPSAGPLAGTNTLTLTGTGFLSGATVNIGASACGSVTVVNATQITCVAPAHAAATLNVTVTNSDGQPSTLNNSYTYQPAPALTSVAPVGGALAGGTALTLTGSGFVSGATVTVGGAACGSISVVSATSITCTSPAHVAGAVNVIVTNADGQTNTLASGYTYEPVPVLSSVSPVAGAVGGGTSITLTGTGFLTGAIVTIGGNACTSVNVSSGTTITCTTPSHVAATVDIIVTNLDTQTTTLTSAYTYEAAPTLTSIAPVAGALGGNTTLTLTGTGFLSGATVTVGGSPCTGVVVNSATQIVCFTPAESAGTVDVIVTNTDNQAATLSASYTYEAAPTVTSIAPAIGSTGGGTTVTLTGTGFLVGAAVSIGGASCTTSLVTSTQILCSTAVHAAGTADVTVTNTDTQAGTLAAGFAYQPGPSLTSVTPVAGPLAGNNTLLLNGTGFLAGIGVTVGGGTCSSVNLLSSTQLTCLAPAHAAATVGIVVTNTDTQTATLAASYTYEAAPTLSNVAPIGGALIGGTAITLTGTGFLTGANVTIGGNTCGSIVVVSGTSITCVTPAHAAGAVDVTVTNTDAQAATLPASFTYRVPPILSSIAPTAGALAGATSVTLTGTNFLNGATVTIGGSACTSVNFVSSTTITCNTPSHAAATVDVTLTNPDTQFSTLTSSYTYEAAPTVTAISPVAGALGGGTNVTLTGTGFLAGAAVTIGGTACTSIVVSSATSILCTTPSHVAGAVDVVVTNTDTQAGTLTNGYTYQAAPTISSIAPVAGALAGGTAVAISGTGFLAGAVTKVGGNVCVLGSITPTLISCTTAAHAAGLADVLVTNTDTQFATSVGAYTFEAAPTLTSVSPTAGPLAGTNTLIINGTGFLAGILVNVGGTACTGVTVVSSSQLTCTAPSNVAGTVDIVVTNTDLQTVTLAASYTYEGAPTLSSVAPTGGALAGNTAITLTGTGFLSGASVTIGGNACASIVVASATSITCTTPAHVAGAVDIVVTNSDGQTVTLPSSFTYRAAPVLSSIAPTAGALGGATVLTLTGTGFVTGATVTVAATACTSVNVVNATTITCNAPAHAAGTFNVVVTNSDTQSSTLTSAYTYEAAPTVTAISPVAGALAGGTNVAITGTGFLVGAAVTLGGTACTAIVVSSATSILCTTAGHSAGAVDVVVTNTDTQAGTLTSGYTYEAAPTIASVSPSGGLPAGGTAITITGTGFLASPAVTIGGNACTVGTVTATQIYCTTVAHAAGVTDVTVTNTDGQNVTASGAFTYENAPTLATVLPVAGPLAGTNTLTLNGTGFLTGISVTVGGATCGSVTVVSGTQLTCAAPAHAAGLVSIVVTNPDTLTATLTNSYTYNAGPTLSTVAPIGGPLAGGTSITLTGTGFLSGAAVTVGGNACASISVVSGTSITCTTPSHAAGAVSIVVTNADAQTVTLTNSYTYAPAPTLTSIAPVAGALGGGTVLTLTGTGFVAGATVTLGVGACTAVNVVSSTSITCNTPSHVAATVNVVVANPDTQSATLTSSYTYEAAPTVSSIAPTAGALAGGTNVTVTGTGFLLGATITIGGVSCGSLVVSSATTILCTTGAHSAATLDVVITNTDTQTVTLTNGYTYEAAPNVISVAPVIGNTTGSTALTINGTGFLSGLAVLVGGVTCTTTSVTGTQIFCNTGAHGAGVVDVTVTNTDTQFSTLSASYTYDVGPVLTSIVPTAGPLNGTNTLTLTGTEFTAGSAVSVGGNACTGVSVVNATTITCTLASHAAGTVSVTVTALDGIASTLTNSYTYQPAPTLSTIGPTGGALAGGTAVTLTGTGFVTGALVTIGGTACASIVVVSGTSITCTTPSGSAGAANVVVTNADSQTVTLSNAYTYRAAPTLASVAPVAGALAGNTTVTLTGTGFVSGAAITFGGTAATSVNVVSATSITCVTPSKAAGTYNVVVTNSDTQSATLTSAYTYEAAPTLTSVSPNGGPLAGGTLVTLTGTGFLAGAGVTFGAASFATSINVVSATSITCLTPSNSAGAYTVTVTNTDTQVGPLAAAYTYRAAPTLSTISPTSGKVTAGIAMTINGTGFVAGAITTMGGATCTAPTITPTQIFCTSPAHAAGVVDVVVTNTDTQSATLTASFTYEAAPTVTSVSPVAGPLNGTNTLTVNGTGFVSGATVTAGGNSCGGVSFVNSTQLTCTLSAHAAGAVSVIATNPDTQTGTLAAAYTYQAAPTVSAVNPTGGALAGGTALTLTGTGFLAGASAAIGGAPCSGLVVVSATSITCTSPAGSAGAVSVVVTNSDNQSGTLSNSYTYRVAPTLSSVSPVGGPLAGTNTLTLNGTGFITGATITVGGGACTSPTFVSSAQLTCTVPSHVAGVVSVVVTNPDTQAVTMTNGYTYQAAPTVTAISPTSGPLAGGTPVTLTGTGFLSGATVSIAGASCSSLIVVSATSITCHRRDSALIVQVPGHR